MRRLMFLAASLAALPLAGCASDVGPTQTELTANWEAKNVFPQGYKSDLLAFLRTYINDPSHIRGAAVSQPVRKQVGPGERYVACVRYSERKDDGSYSPSKNGAATFVSGKLDRFFDVPREIDPVCRDAAFAPFPELERLSR